MCWLRLIKMRLCGVFLAVHIVRVYSVSNFFSRDDTDYQLTIAGVRMHFHLLCALYIVVTISEFLSFSGCFTNSENTTTKYICGHSFQANIVDECFGSSEGWSELLIISDHAFNEIVGKIYRGSKTSNSIIFLENGRYNDRFTRYEQCNEYLNTSFEWQETKPRAVVIIIRGIKELESVLSFLKKGIQRMWRPKSNFFIVLETRCDVTECNNMFKIIWDYWILNAVILCSSNDAANRNETEIELYTFNPYSDDHSRQWEIIINETVEVSISPGNFNHSWYIFKQRFTEIRLSDDCGHLFFDKTFNLDGYVIPVSLNFDEFLSDSAESQDAKLFAADRQTLKTVAKKLRFNIAQLITNDTDRYGQLLGNGSYTGVMNDIYNGQSHLAAAGRDIGLYPGIEMTYPHVQMSACFASRIIGNWPQWKNLADAKNIWISLGLGLIFSAIVLYLQNKSHGIVSAFINAERLILGASIIRPSTVVKHRIILGSIFLVLLVVDGAIRGRFISILTVARPYPNLDTLMQLKEQDVDMYGDDLIKAVIIDSQLKARFSNKIILGECIDSIERGEPQRACFTSCLILKYLLSNSSNIHTASIPFWSTSAGYLTAKHWPMTNRFSLVAQKLTESGIFEKWQFEVYREYEVNSWRAKRAAESPYVRAVKPNDLLPAFVLLSVGLSIALFIFAWEIRGRKNFYCVES